MRRFSRAPFFLAVAAATTASSAFGDAPKAAAKPGPAIHACPSDKVWSDAAGGCVCTPTTAWDQASHKCVPPNMVGRVPVPAPVAKHATPSAAGHSSASSSNANAVPANPMPVAASRGWHTPTPGKSAPVDASGRPQLVLQGINHTDHCTLTAQTDRGGFSAHDLDRAAHVLRESWSGNEHPVDPRVLDLVYRVATHFNAHEVRIISGYRTPKNGSHSNHGKGRAIDLVIPGTSDEEVAKFAREQGFVGVGVYPVSGFVHLDVRERSFFWVDYSGPGKRNRTRGILADLAQKSDQRAIARGEHGVPPFLISHDVDSVLKSGSTIPTSPTIEDDDTDENPELAAN